MTGKEIRKRFIEFFKKRGHKIVPSSSLISDDPTVLLTSAGMQQFKPYFLGQLDPFKDVHPGLGEPLGTRRLVTVQKSFRTTDIGEVGDTTHLTFFEMLGNFSFGDYSKKDAIQWSWELLTDQKTGFGLDPGKISVTVFKGDEDAPFDQEAYDIWQSVGMPEQRIYKFGKEKNWWEPMGDDVPAGPDTEIFYDTGVSHGPHTIDGCGPNCDCNRYVEIWNDVFMEYVKRGGRYQQLAQKNVDTGSGLERVATVVQGKQDVYETDLLTPISSAVRKAASSLDDRSVRIITDHLRASVFLISDGVVPLNKEQGYILRRLLRRSLILTRNLGTQQWYGPVIDIVIREYGDTYVELKKKRDHILAVVSEEADKFSRTLGRGMKEFDRLAAGKSISGEDAFRLYETYGFPIELTEELAKERNFTINRGEIEAAQKQHQNKSREGAEGKFGGHGLLSSSGEIVGGSDDEKKRILRLHTATHLLHQALRDVFGDTVQQKGSDINGERLRFDFSHKEKLTPEQIKKVESIVNEKIKKDLPVYRMDMPFAEAQKTGALAFFKDKYGGTVSVYFIGSEDPVKAYSKEFCAGPHVGHTDEIGTFKILKEEAVGAGTRRIKATVE